MATSQIIRFLDIEIVLLYLHSRRAALPDLHNILQTIYLPK